MASLLQLSSQALGEALGLGPGQVPDLAALPDAELAMDVWRHWRQVVMASAAARPYDAGSVADAAAARRPPSLQRAVEVLRAFAAAFWRPQLLRLAYSATAAVPPGLASLPLVSQQLLHLELAAPSLWSLDALQTACPQLRCLSLRGCARLGDAALAALPQCCPALRALDLGGLAQLSDGTAYHVARLPQLAALNLSGTAVTDQALELLTYGHAARAWQQAAGAAQLPPEAACWPAPPLEHLQLEGTRVGAPGLALLERLPQLRCGALAGGGEVLA